MVWFWVLGVRAAPQRGGLWPSSGSLPGLFGVSSEPLPGTLARRSPTPPKEKTIPSSPGGGPWVSSSREKKKNRESSPPPPVIVALWVEICQSAPCGVVLGVWSRALAGCFTSWLSAPFSTAIRVPPLSIRLWHLHSLNMFAATTLSFVACIALQVPTPLQKSRLVGTRKCWFLL